MARNRSAASVACCAWAIWTLGIGWPKEITAILTMPPQRRRSPVPVVVVRTGILG